MQPDHASHAPRANGALNRFIGTLPRLFVPTFALMFYIFSICFAVAAVVEFAIPVLEHGDFVQGLIKGLHTGVVALAVYELAEIVHQEYDPDGQSHNVLARIRRGVARFGAVVIVALVLESLIMVIKYSQENLAGFLYYPAAIIVAAALLLTALGLFAKLTSTPVRAARE